MRDKQRAEVIQVSEGSRRDVGDSTKIQLSNEMRFSCCWWCCFVVVDIVFDVIVTAMPSYYVKEEQYPTYIREVMFKDSKAPACRIDMALNPISSCPNSKVLWVRSDDEWHDNAGSYLTPFA
jgi:hypothetical protein